MEEATLLCSLLPTYARCWIGLTDYGRTVNEFYWTDGSKWDYGCNISDGAHPWGIMSGILQLNNAHAWQEDCVSINFVYQTWRVAYCAEPNHFLCNMPSLWYIFQ